MDEHLPAIDVAAEPTEPQCSKSNEFRLSLVQHALYWLAIGLFATLLVVSWRSKATMGDVYSRQNLLLPRTPDVFVSRWYLTCPAIAAIFACFWFRLRRMVVWREWGRRPEPIRWVRCLLTLELIALFVLVAPPFLE